MDAEDKPSIVKKLGTKGIVLIVLGVIAIAIVLYFWMKPKAGKALPKAPTTDPAPKKSGPTDADLSSIKPGADSVFYYFWSPECPHCERFHTTWKELMNHFKDRPDLSFQAVDVTKPVNQGLAFHYNIEMLPTLILEARDKLSNATPTKMSEYTGRPFLQDLIAFVTKEMDTISVDDLVAEEDYPSPSQP